MVKPEVVEGDAASAATVKAWITGDSKAKSDISLSIHPSELKQIKGCATSREVWLKLESIFQSKVPARKATLIKQLTLQRMDDGDDTREHVRKFFDAKDKLGEMDVEVNPNLLSILLFYSLPTSFENFRCKEFGHKVAECTNRKDERSRQYAKKADDVVLCAIESFVEARRRIKTTIQRVSGCSYVSCCGHEAGYCSCCERSQSIQLQLRSNTLDSAKRVLRYLKGTINLGLSYQSSEGQLEGFVDADWASCLVDKKSYTGYVFTLNRGAISWNSCKQKTIALSSTEAEYMGLAEITKEAIYLRGFLLEFGFRGPEAVKISNDNMGALKLSENPVFHTRSKHIDVRHHFIQDSLKNGLIKINYLPTEAMVADILTKGLPVPKHRNCVQLLRLEEV
ncbi:uncharacterized protein LOC127284555 [Leptopilina boulardi]|uniref:uncharacterized protein LOC127284555 n=1 Tax=Leptopilina boulardi TaxID=63433 RepID=UPI0021F53A1A|nr:uncharacterized protein LOC127284555 [Leptopilina boulardi]